MSGNMYKSTERRQQRKVDTNKWKHTKVLRKISKDMSCPCVPLVEFMYLVFTLIPGESLVEFMYLVFTLIPGESLVEFMYLVFTFMPGESCCRQLGSVLLCLSDIC